MHAELRRDRAHRPLLAVEETHDLRFGFLRDHRRPPCSSRRSPRRPWCARQPGKEEAEFHHNVLSCSSFLLLEGRLRGATAIVRREEDNGEGDIGVIKNLFDDGSTLFGSSLGITGSSPNLRSSASTRASES